MAIRWRGARALRGLRGVARAVVGGRRLAGRELDDLGAALLREDDELARRGADERVGRARVARHLEDAEARLVEHLPELVQRVQARGVLELALAAVVEDHR